MTKKRVASARDKADEWLRLQQFFQRLSGAMTGVGLPGEEGLGIGVFFVFISRLQPYPLRLRIREETPGTANFIVKKVSKLFAPGTMITVSPSTSQDWDRFAEAPNGKVAFFPELEAEIKTNRYRRFDIQQNRLVRIVAVAQDDDLDGDKRFVEEAIKDSDVIQGSFACVTPDRFPDYKKRTRWLTMKQPPQRDAVPAGEHSLDDDEVEIWHEVQALLEERARLPILFPDWMQLVVDEMCEKGEKHAVHVATLLQSWRTMTLLHSFGSRDALVLKPTFMDFAATIALTKKLFIEAKSFPSAKKVFQQISAPGQHEGLFHPVTGKLISFRHQYQTKFRNLLGLD